MKQIAFMIVFVMILGSILTTSLVFVDRLTGPRIKVNEQRKVYRSVLDALDIPFERENVDRAFKSNVTVNDVGGQPFYKSNDGAVAFEVLGSGLWGPIYGVVALQPDHKTIKGITVISQEETPGLGSRIAEKDYLDMFKGKTLLPSIKIVKEGEAKASNEVDGITGATLSSKAFERVLNDEAGKKVAILEGSAK